jgi:GH24 family phage-related lysozyme (muramidase)
VNRIEGVIAKAYQDGQGRWVITTGDGQVWTETEAETFYPEPEAGDRIEIRVGMLGAYFIKINNNVGFKVRRDK